MARDVAPLVPDAIQPLRVVFPLALLDALALPKSPSDARVRLSDVLTGLAAASLGTFRGRGAKAIAAVAGVKVSRGVVMKIKGGGRDGFGLGKGRQACEGDAVSDGGLLLARDVHHVEGEEFTWDMREGYVEIDGKLLERRG